MAEFNPFDPVEESGPSAPVFSAPPRAPKPPKPPKNQEGTPRVELVGGGKGGFGQFVRRFWKIIAAAAALVVVLAVFSGAILARIAPAWTVRRAAAKAADDVIARMEDAPWGAFGVLYGAVQDGRIGVDIDSAYSPLHSAVLASNLKDREFSLQADFEAAGKEDSVTFYLNTQRAAVESSLLDDAYGVTFRTVEDDLWDSALPDLLNLSDEDIARIGDQMNAVAELLESDTDASKLAGKLEDVYKDFLKELDFSTESDKTRIGGERVSCTVISASFDQRDIRNLVLDAYDAMTDDPAVRDLMLLNMTGYDMDEDEAEDYLDAQIRSTRDGLRESFEALSLEADLAYYLSGGRLVRAEIQATVEDSQRMELTLELGEDPAADDWHMELTAGGDYGDGYRMTADYTSETEGDVYTDRLTITTSEDGYDAAAELSTRWDRKSGDLDLTVLRGDEPINFHCNLTVDGGSFRLVLDDQSIPDFGPGDSVTVWAEEGASVEDPKFINLDEWDAQALEALQEALAGFAEADAGSSDVIFDF